MKKNWTESEIRKLKEKWGLISKADLVKTFKRSFSSLTAKARELNLEPYNKAVISNIEGAILTSDLCKMFTISKITLNLWIDNGLNVIHNNFTNLDYVLEVDLVAFLKEYKYLWDSRLLVDDSFLDNEDWYKEKQERDLYLSDNFYRSRYFFTYEDDDYIRENFNKITFADMARKFGCNIQTVQKRALELGLDYERKNVGRWTKEEDDLLREYSKKYIKKTIAKKMNKSVVAIQKRALKIGVELHSTRDSWKKWMVDYLKDNINKKSLRKISQFLGMSTNQIKNKCEELGIEINSKSPNWTEEEIKILKEHAMECHYSELTKYLPNRTVGSIGYKLSTLGIKHISEYTTLNRKQKKYIKDNWGKKKIIEIANDLGVSYRVIERYKKILKLPNVEQEKKWTKEVIKKIEVDAKTKTQEQLAKKYNTSVSQIRKIARDNNIIIKTKRTVWTDEMDKKLIELIQQGKVRREIAIELNVTRSTLDRHIKLINKTPKRDKEVWTENDIKSLKILSKANFAKDIAKIINKTEHQVKEKARRLDIDLLTEEEFWTEEKIQKLIELNKENYIHITSQNLGICEASIINKLRELKIYVNYKPRTSWDPEEEKKLVKLSKEMTIRELSEVLDRSTGSVGAKLRYMGLSAKKTPEKWTTEEIEKLIIMSEDYTFDQIAKELNKTYEAVQNKLYKLGIKRRLLNEWSDEEIKLLSELLKEKSPSEVAHIMGRSYDSVINNAVKNNIEIDFKSRPWTKEDEELLTDIWGNYSIETIAKKLNRTESSIRNRVFILGLGAPISNFYGGILLTDVLTLLNINRNKLYDWALLGLNIKSKKITNNRSYQYVTQEDLLEFLKNNQDLWDSRYLEKNIFGIEPEWLKLKRQSDEEIDAIKPVKVRKKQLILNNQYYAKESDNNE